MLKLSWKFKLFPRRTPGSLQPRLFLGPHSHGLVTPVFSTQVRCEGWFDLGQWSGSPPSCTCGWAASGAPSLIAWEIWSVQVSHLSNVFMTILKIMGCGTYGDSFLDAMSPWEWKPQIMPGLDDSVGFMLSHDKDPSEAMEHWKISNFQHKDRRQDSQWWKRLTAYK